MVLKCSLLVMFAATIQLIYCDTTSKCPICARTPKHYQELRCVGKLDENGCCIESFECPDLNIFDIKKCHLKGRSYDILERVSLSDTPFCSHTCTCAEQRLDESGPSIQCAYSECPTIFKPKLEFKNCVFQYDPNGCCRIRQVCGDKETRKLAKCTLDGKTYREGELMYPLSSSCYSCICTNTFDKSIPPESNKDCRLIDCEMEIHYFHELRIGCVPVYYSSSSCCPIRFRCPNENDEVMQDDVSPGKTCKFGDLSLYVGQRLNADDKCIECTCKQPPMLECIRKELC